MPYKSVIPTDKGEFSELGGIRLFTAEDAPKGSLLYPSYNCTPGTDGRRPI